MSHLNEILKFLYLHDLIKPLLIFSLVFDSIMHSLLLDIILLLFPLLMQLHDFNLSLLLNVCSLFLDPISISEWKVSPAACSLLVQIELFPFFLYLGFLHLYFLILKLNQIMIGLHEFKLLLDIIRHLLLSFLYETIPKLQEILGIFLLL